LKLFRNLTEAVADALHEIFEEGRYADKVIEKVLKQNPKWGARDRRFIAETTYDIVRWHRLFYNLIECDPNDYWRLIGAWCFWNRVDLPRWNEFERLDKAAFFERWDQAQHILNIKESIPDWLDELGQKELGKRWPVEMHALNEQAKVVLRVNTLKVTRADLQQQLKTELIESEAPAEFPDALILAERQNIFTRQQFRDGLFEVQDAGSQLIAPFLQPQPGMRVIDACAGAGGKTLHLAALMKDKGRIIAMDTEAFKLDELKKRARRAGASNNIETRVIDSSKVIKRLEDSADRVLLDVPCSGLGVLRRNPDAKWKLSPEFIEEVKVTQQQVLTQYSAMLKKDGLLVYSTCSILPAENENQVRAFLESHPQFEMQEQRTLMPSAGFDGFYMARLKRLA
jgi:16S rRNA (cytosine967-C5)-methyltransferase